MRTPTCRCLLLLLLLGTAALSAGCGAPLVTLDSDYGSYRPEDELEGVDIHVLAVHDERGVEMPTLAGTGKTGMFNKEVPAYLPVPLDLYVHKSLLENFGPKNHPIVPVTVWVDTLQVWETTGFSESAISTVSMRFGFQSEDGQTRVVRSRAEEHIPGGLDATGKLSRALHASLWTASEQLAGLLRESDAARFASVAEIEAAEPVVVSRDALPPPEETAVAGNIFSVDMIREFGIWAGYTAGEKVQSGFRGVFEIGLRNPHRKYLFSSGLGFRYYDVLNEDDGLEGNFFGLSAPLAIRWFTNAEQTGPFFGLSLDLAYGSESIDSSDSSDTEFFFGGMFKPMLGVALAEGFFLEAGVQGTKLWNSKLLPSDVGFEVGVRIPTGRKGGGR